MTPTIEIISSIEIVSLLGLWRFTNLGRLDSDDSLSVRIFDEFCSLMDPSGESVIPSSISWRSLSSLVHALPWFEIAREHSIQYPGVGMILCG